MKLRIRATNKRFIPRLKCVRWTLLFIFAIPVSPIWAQTAPAPAPADPAGDDGLSAEELAEPEAALGDDARPADPAGDDGLSAEELAELEAALGEDASVLAESRPTPSASGSSGAVASMNPDISLILALAAAYFSDAEHLQTGAHDPGETGFVLQQLEMSLGKAVDPYFRVDANLVFSAEGAEVEEAYTTTLALPWNLQARAGQFLTRIGRINATHPHTWDFVDQPFAIGRLFGAEGNRGMGFELSLLSPLPWYADIIVSVTDARGAESARSFFGDQDLAPASPLDFQMSFMLEQFFDLSANWSLFWGLSVATGPNATGDDHRSELYATDLYLKYRPITRGSYTIVSLQTEWLHRRRQIVGDRLSDTSGYAHLFWRFHKRWNAAVRYEYGSPARTRDGTVGADDLDPEWTRDRHRLSVNTTFWPTEFSRIRLQGSVDMPTWRAQSIQALMLSLEFNIGAHGAHAY